MATTFESIYARCRGRIKDYDKEGYTDEMFAAVEKDLLQAAIDDFVDICAKDLTDYDEELEEFNITLSRKEQSILALSMIVHWLEPYVFNSDALKNAMSTKDFSMFSPAKLLLNFLIKSLISLVPFLLDWASQHLQLSWVNLK